MKIFRNILFVTIPILLVGCATMLSPTYKKIKIDSNVSDVKVSIDGKYMGLTPLKVRVNRNYPKIRIDYNHDKYGAKYDYVTWKTGVGWVLLDFTFFPYAHLMDSYTGAWKVPRKRRYFVDYSNTAKQKSLPDLDLQLENKKLRLIFRDDFKNNSYGWETGKDHSENSYLSDSKYYLKNFDKKNWHWFTKNSSIKTNKDFAIATSVHLDKTKDKKHRYGLIFGGNQYNSFYLFQINNEYKSFAVFKVENGKFQPIINWTKSSFIEKKSNNLMISKSGNKIFYYINDNYVAQTDYKPFFGSKLGYYVSPKTQIHSDWISAVYINNNLERKFSSTIPVNKWSSFETLKETDEYKIEVCFKLKSSSCSQSKINKYKYRITHFKTHSNKTFEWSMNITDCFDNYKTIKASTLKLLDSKGNQVSGIYESMEQTFYAKSVNSYNLD